MNDSSSLLAGNISHYRIIEKIGAGGMGVVYRAHDDQLDRDVALKVLPSGTVANEEARKQFRKEALALAKLNHPNIETVFEFSTHDGMDFLAMELITGQTLTQKLKDGPLPQEDIVRLALQISDGLSAAHEKGIIHRDIKPANMIITPDGRLKILDFGLAMLIQPERSVDLTQSVTLDDGRASGTLPYMSPEQLRGLSLDSRSDIFAAGVVLYEMATGRRPFLHSHTVELMAAILHKTPDAPSLLNAGVSPGLERVICTALEKEPANRYHTAREMRVALDGISSRSGHTNVRHSETQPDATPARAFPRSHLVIAGIAILLIVLTTLWHVSLDRGREHAINGGDRSEAGSTSVAPVRSRRSVAVLGFKNLSQRPDKAWFSTAIPGMLTTELAAGEQLRTVSGEEVAQMTTSLLLPEADGYGKETLQKIHKNLNADVVVVGSYLVLGDGQVRLDLRLQNALEGVTVASVSEKGREDRIDELVSKAGAELREKLGIGAVSLKEAAEIRATLPSSTKATRLYAEGIAKLREFDALAARDLLQKAILEDSHFAMAHSALAAAYAALGNDEKARLSARNAFDLSSDLSREDRLLVEARYHEANHEWDGATKSYSALFDYFSDNLEYGIFLAGSQIHGGKPKDALKTIEALRRLPAPAREDPRIDVKAAEAYLSIGEFDKAQSSASAGVQRAQSNNARLILADARFRQAQASENLNQPTEATSSIQEATRIYSAAGNLSGEARSLEVMANIFADKSDFANALASYKKQLSIARDIGNRHLEASALNNMGIVLKGQDDPEQAKKMWEQALSGFNDVNDKGNSAEVLVNLGGISLEAGDLNDAKKIYERALSTSQEVNDQSGVSTATAALGTVLDAQGNLPGAQKMLERAIEIDLSAGLKSAAPDKLLSLGDVLQHQGNLLLAKKTYQDALKQSQEAGDKSNTAYALMGLGKIALEKADFQESRKYLEEALAIQTELRAKRNMAATNIALAELDIEEGHAADSSDAAKNAMEEFRNLRDRDDELAAVVTLVRALLSQGKLAAAARELQAESGLVGKSQNPLSKIEFEMATASVEAASRKTVAANERLKRALNNATKLAFIKLQLECRLAMQEAASKDGKSPESGAVLNELVHEALEKGFVRIARKAEQFTKA